MKKKETQDLIKWVSIFLLISVVLSWIVDQSQIIQGTLSSEEIVTVGVFQIFFYLIEACMYVVQFFPVVFIVPGFYAVLGATKMYSKLVDTIADKFKNHVKVFVAVSTLIYACLAGISTNYIALFALVPFTISILAKLKVDKITGFVSSFGGILVGILGATYNPGLLYYATSPDYGFGLEYGFELVGAIVLFALAYCLLVYFAFNRIDKSRDIQKEDLLVDPFDTYVESEIAKKKEKKEQQVSIVPLAITLVITFIVTILAFIGWEEVFSINIFADIYDWIIEATLFGKPIFAYILGPEVVSAYGVQTVLGAFGSWELFTLSAFLVLMLLVVKILYRIPLNTMVTNFVDGLKKSTKSIVILTLIYTTVYVSIQYHSTIPYFINEIVEGSANVFTAFLSGGLMSIFATELGLVIRSLGTLFSNFKNLDIVLLAIQAAYGFVSFIAPTSFMLMLGLSTLDIKYKDYFKFIWKFLLILLILIIAVLAILTI